MDHTGAGHSNSDLLTLNDHQARLREALGY